MITGIYKFTNTINNKVYIGQSVDVQHRKREHLRHKEDSYFHKALQKHGNNNFIFEVLEECDKTLLNEREKHWISYYQSNERDKGYNLTSGGEGAQKKSIQQFDLQNNFIKEFASGLEASLTTGIPAANISRCCHKRSRSAGGYKWKFKDDLELDYIVKPKINKGGRKSKENVVVEWQKENPTGTKAQCIKETGLSPKTVYKYWK